MLHSKGLEIGVGLFVTLGIAAIFMLAMKASNMASYSSDDGYDLIAYFDNVGGLKVRSQVAMSGVTIGRVKAIDFDDTTYQAVVTMNIHGEYQKIPEDTFANIFTAGLLGEQYISLDPGGSDVYLKAGDKIKQTQSALVLEQVVGQFLFDKASGHNKPASDATPAPVMPDEQKAEGPWSDPFR